MKLISIKQAKPGYRIAKPIYTSRGTPLIQIGVELTSQYITRLTEFGQAWIYVETEDSRGIEIEELVDSQLRFRAAEAIRDATEVIADPNVPAEKKTIPKRQATLFQSVVDDIAATVSESAALSGEMLGLKSGEEYYYLHGVNVAVISIMLAVKDGWPRSKITAMGLGALLHDIGIAKIVKLGEITPNDRMPDAIYRPHVRFGWELIKSIADVSPTAANVALRHHEQWDGGGYPDGLEGKDIHEFSRLVAAANLYDGLISPRPWRPPVPPDMAIDFIEAQAGKRLDPRVVKLFVKYVDPYPVGLEVELSNGLVGIVALPALEDRRRPVLRLVRAADGRPLEKPVLVDLSEMPDVKIARAIL